LGNNGFSGGQKLERHFHHIDAFTHRDAAANITPIQNTNYLHKNSPFLTNKGFQYNKK